MLTMAKPDASADHIEQVPDQPSKQLASDQDEVNALPVSLFVWVVAATASIAGMLFGYDTGIISAVLVYINDDLNNRALKHSEKEMITSLCSGGAFFGAIAAGSMADRVGALSCWSNVLADTLAVWPQDLYLPRLCVVHRWSRAARGCIYHRTDGRGPVRRRPGSWIGGHDGASVCGRAGPG